MASVLHLLRELRGIFRGDTVLIYSMGKVGSSSVKHSLDAIGVPVVHLHNFTGEQYVDFGHSFRGVKSSLNTGLMKLRLRLIGIAFRCSRHARVITLMRDPVARNISVMFQGLDRLMDRGMQACNSNQDEALQYIFDHLINHDIPGKWFEREFTAHTGIEICSQDSASRDYLLFKTPRIDVLLLKLEALNGLEQVIGTFVDRPEFKLKQANASEGKWYAELYGHFKKNIVLTSDYLDRMYDSPVMKHLYSPAEIERFRARWKINL